MAKELLKEVSCQSFKKLSEIVTVDGSPLENVYNQQETGDWVPKDFEGNIHYETFANLCVSVSKSKMEVVLGSNCDW